MLPAAHQEELHRALTALEAVIGLRLEERRSCAVRAGLDAEPERAVAALMARPLGLEGTEGLPAVHTYAGDGPLARVVRDCSLDAAEALALLAAVAPEIDEKFALYYGLLADRPGASHLTGEVLRTLCARTFAGRLAARELLAAHGRLRGARLLDLTAAEGGTLAGRVVPHRALVAYLTGGPVAGGPPPDLPVDLMDTAHTLDDIVVPGPVRRRLATVLERVRHKHTVLEEWGFARAHDGVRGTLVLFHGPPGTGKSMTAAVLGRTLGVPAYRVDVSALVSKYIGETEKNLARVFDWAEEEECLLVFDEADAVFGRRTEVSDAHDRYANQEVSYLLQRVERHRGVVVLTTNLLGNIDEAFARRIDLRVEFPAPGAAERLAIWRGVLPARLPVAEDLGLPALAERYPLTGAEILDAALAAAYAAAADGRVVTREHLTAGIGTAFAKSGRTPPSATG
ncbi:ATP-binding protein [Streptomyces sp. NPDC058326]|uniref:ATP-binding protein n=1 Tax=Streptomyces sp. NPDC058326 TaxID=3346447 RepID=UPI0036EBBF49